ncbi:hypothetical protein LLG95_12420 [bacterium]|nr:hypothetical protein [bacterium]
MSRYILLSAIVLSLLPAACTTTAKPPATQPTAQSVQPLVAKPVLVPATPLPAPSPAAAPDPKPQSPDLVIAILDFESDTVPAEQTMALSQALAVSLFQPKEYGMLPRVETRRYLVANDLYPWMPYRADVPLVRVVGALKVNCLATGRVEKLGSGGYDLSIQLIGLDGLPIVVKSQQVTGGIDDVATTIEQLAPSIRESIVKSRSAAPSRIHTDKKLKSRLKRAPVQEKAIKPKDEKPAALVAAAAPAQATPAPAKTAAPVETAKPEPKPSAAEVIPIATATPKPSPTPTATPKTLVLRATPKTSPQPTAAPTAKPAAKAAKTPADDKVAKARELQKEANRLAVKNDKRLELLKQASELAPNDLQVLRGLANEYYLRDDFPKCVEVYTRALKIEPNNSMLLTFRGSAHYCQDQLAEASEDFGRAVQLDPGNHFARYNFALAAHMRKLPEAEKLWRDYLDKSKGVADQEDQRKEAQRYLATLGKGAH